MSFKVNKCLFFFSSGDKKPKEYQYEMSEMKFEIVQCVKTISVMITLSLKFSQHCKDADDKANTILGFINITIPFKITTTISPLYISEIKPHLELAV